MALLRCPRCHHVQVVATAGTYACPSCDHGTGTTVAPRLPPQTSQDYRDLYYQEATLQLAAEQAGRAPVQATFGKPKAPKPAAGERRPWWSRSKPDPAHEPEPQASTAVGVVEKPAKRVKAGKEPKQPKEPKVRKQRAPREPGKSKRNWFAKTSFGTAWGAFVFIAAGATGAILRLEDLAGFSIEDRFGFRLDRAIGWPTVVSAVVFGILGIWWAKRNPNAKGAVRSVFGILLGLALGATLFIDVTKYIDPFLAP